MSPRVYHRPGLREALLERAMDVVHDDGVDALSLRALARDLDVSHAAPTRHFRDRQALLDSLALEGFRRLNRIIEGAAVADESAFDSRLGAVATAYVEFAVENPALLDLMYSTKHGPDASEALQSAGRTALVSVSSMIRRAQEDGLLREGDPDELALVAFACVHGVALLATGGMLDGVPVEHATAQTIDMLRRGMAAD